MTIRLFFSAASPYVRKVMVSAHERGLDHLIDKLPSAAGPVKRDQTIVPHNGSGKVPCALLDDDVPIFDSRVICAYIDTLADEAGTLYPRDGQRFTVLTLEALADSILDAALLCRYEKAMRPEALFWDDWYRGQMEKIDSGLDALESKWFKPLTTTFHAGAIAAACALGYLDFRFADEDWRSRRPNLAGWFEQISNRPSMKATMPHA